MDNSRRLSSAYTSERQGIFPATTLHVNHPPDSIAQGASTPVSPNEKTGGDNTTSSVLVVGWDGPEDPKNPKK